MTIYSIDAKTIQFELLLEKDISWPKFELNINYHITDETLINSHLKKNNITLPNVSDEIVLTYYSKKSQHTVTKNGQIVHNQNIKINKMWVNNVQIDLGVIKNNFVFYPIYDEEFKKHAIGQNETLPETINTTNLYHNGSLHFKIYQPFFYWYNSMELQVLSNFNKLVKYHHLGIGDEDTLLILQNINNLLKK